LRLPLPSFDAVPWVAPPALDRARVAIISTAGLHRRSDARFAGGSADYRIIPSAIDYADLLMSHASVNFDRSGFQQDINVVFPLELLQRLASAGEIASVADWHYSFMGPPTRPDGGDRRPVGKLLRRDGVEAALLILV
jgi:D-proline reductase (dithiol) PrdB